MSHPEPKPATHVRATAPRGQVLVIFAFLLTILIGMAAFVVDLAWIWSHQLQVQRAADAGALAGVVHLPANPAAAESAALAESKKNGYEATVDGVDIEAFPDPAFSRRMIVTVSAPVETFFMGLFGFDTVTVTRTARAEYILPVPMGSPQNYLGVGTLRDAVTTTTTTTNTVAGDTGDFDEHYTEDGFSGQWSNSDDADDEDNDYATEDSNGQSHQWREFDLQDDIPNQATLQILEIEVRLEDIRLTGSGNSSSCRVRTELSWNNGGTWSTAIDSTITQTSGNGIDVTVGTTTTPQNTAPWGSHVWTRNDFANGSSSNPTFRVRLTWQEPNSQCGSNRGVQLDALGVKVHWRYTSTTVTSNTEIEEVDVCDPYAYATQGGPGCSTARRLVPQRFWLGMQSQGAPARQGDAYQTQYDPVGDSSGRTSSPNANWCPFVGKCTTFPDGYYNYAIEIPSNGGEVWIFDPGFCDTTGVAGTGEDWTIGGNNGANDTRSVSAFYRLYNTQQTSWDFADDTRVDGQAGNPISNEIQPSTYRRGVNNNNAKYYDEDIYDEIEGNGEEPDNDGGYTDCGSQSWHNNWWRIGSGLAAGTYRLHTTSHDRILTTDQSNTTALNSFAIWASAGGLNINNVKVYGLGAMEAYFPVVPGQDSEFYLAQIEAVHANKWVDISLWDAGDTNGVTADLSILMPQRPGASTCGQPDYCPVPFYWNRTFGTTIPDDFTCGPSTSGLVSSIRTNNGGNSTGNFNGDWLRLCFQLPSNWTAPIPTPDSLTPAAGQGGGWFRIFYDIGGGSGNPTDLTTWKVEVRGNPAHLITPGDDVPTP